MLDSDYSDRRIRLLEATTAAGFDVVFLPPSADLEYLTGMKRRLPTFGDIGYANDWVAGALLAPGLEPVFLLPRMVVEFDLPSGIPGALVTIAELDDGQAVFAQVARRFGAVEMLGIGARTRGDAVIGLLDAFGHPEVADVSPLVNVLRRIKSEDELTCMQRAAQIADATLAEVTSRIRPGVKERDLAEEIDHQMAMRGSRSPSFDTGVWSIGSGLDRDADDRLSSDSITPDTSVSFDFGAVVDGYCSDFGRTVHVGAPGPEFVAAYELVIEAQAAGIAAARPGVTAAEVDRACREVIAEAGQGAWFRHRTGHCIGLDVHEKPYISIEDETILEPGMTFTVEPSLYRPGVVGARVEDIMVCEEGGSRRLNDYPTALVVIE